MRATILRILHAPCATAHTLLSGDVVTTRRSSAHALPTRFIVRDVGKRARRRAHTHARARDQHAPTQVARTSWLRHMEPGAPLSRAVDSHPGWYAAVDPSTKVRCVMRVHAPTHTHAHTHMRAPAAAGAGRVLLQRCWRRVLELTFHARPAAERQRVAEPWCVPMALRARAWKCVRT